MLVVFENFHVQFVELSVCGVGGGHAHLLLFERLIEKAEVHAFGCGDPFDGVCSIQRAIRIGAREEFVAGAERETGGIGCGVAQGFEMARARVFAANGHGEGIVEAEGIEPVEMKTAGIFGADLFENNRRIGDAAALQHVGERGSGVFRIHIDIAREQRLVREQRSAEIEFAFHRLVQARFDVLRDDLAEDELLGEVLGADHDVISRAAAGE